MKNYSLLSFCLLLVAAGCAHLSPEAAARRSEALDPHGYELSQRGAAWLLLLGETTHCVGEFVDCGSSRQR